MKHLFLVVLFAPVIVFAANPDIKEMFKDKTKIENPFELRDPFKAPPGKNGNKSKKPGYRVTGVGSYTNIVEVSTEEISAQDIKIVGVLIGKERRALANIKGAKSVTILKEGMKLGRDEAELKAILPGGIILVEKIINVYGQEEYLETVIPISK